MARKRKTYLYQKQKTKNSGKFFVIFIVVIALAVAGVALVVLLFNGGATGSSNDTTTGESLTPVTAMNDSKSDWTLSSFESESPSEISSEIETPGAAATHDKPVPESVSADLSYFGDALFIGDSRTEGFMMYSEVDTATYYTYKGLSVNTVATKEFVPTPDGGKTTVMEALKERQFAKVYVMLGVNELGWAYPDIFVKRYGELVDAVKMNNPGAIVYVQSILPVSRKKEGDAVYNNVNVSKFNSLIQMMVQEKQVYYVNPAEAVSQDGWLMDDATSDGIHLNKKYCIIWRDYLMTHTVLKG